MGLIRLKCNDKGTALPKHAKQQQLQQQLQIQHQLQKTKQIQHQFQQQLQIHKHQLQQQVQIHQSLTLPVDTFRSPYVGNQVAFSQLGGFVHKGSTLPSDSLGRVVAYT